MVSGKQAGCLKNVGPRRFLKKKAVLQWLQAPIQCVEIAIYKKNAINFYCHVLCLQISYNFLHKFPAPRLQPGQVCCPSLLFSFALQIFCHLNSRVITTPRCSLR